MKITIVENKKTKQQYAAEYAPNRLHNKRLWVNGKFYSDREFDRTFKIIKSKEI